MPLSLWASPSRPSCPSWAAYGILSDEKKRADYDARLKEADVRPEGKKAAKKPSGNNGYQKNGYQKNEKMKANPLDVSDLFERYMGIRK